MTALKRILFIDDDIRMESLFRRLLPDNKYYLMIETSGKNALEQLHSLQPDVIFCDILMPELDGYGVLHYVRQYEATRLTKFIFLTALDGTSNLLTGISKGADGYLTKPVSRDDLLEAIETW
jgi:CheY-like chemotaxis protein